ncbi:MAG: hypothetical protein L0206_00235 [Actinobacteria bacterium]|nr:hypothetical protein [Actinomycetota bacterium]
MATCITCGDELHPERAEKYDYCTKTRCRERNARPSRIASVGVNKAADQFVVLDDRTQREIASGRYKRAPEVSGSSPQPRPRTGSTHSSKRAPVLVPRSSGGSARPRWSDAQENLALTYRAMGLRREEIAKKLGVSPYLVGQILASATSRRGR